MATTDLDATSSSIDDITSSSTEATDPLTGYSMDVTSDNEAMAANMSQMIQEQAWESQLTTSYQFHSQMIKSLFDALQNMIRNFE